MFFLMQICNAVAVAKIMNATLILPVLKQDQIWKDKTWDTFANINISFNFIFTLIEIRYKQTINGGNC